MGGLCGGGWEPVGLCFLPFGNVTRKLLGAFEANGKEFIYCYMLCIFHIHYMGSPDISMEDLVP